MKPKIWFTSVSYSVGVYICNNFGVIWCGLIQPHVLQDWYGFHYSVCVPNTWKRYSHSTCLSLVQPFLSQLWTYFFTQELKTKSCWILESFLWYIFVRVIFVVAYFILRLVAMLVTFFWTAVASEGSRCLLDIPQAKPTLCPVLLSLSWYLA